MKTHFYLILVSIITFNMYNTLSICNGTIWKTQEKNVEENIIILLCNKIFYYFVIIIDSDN